jgi:hypothetical protein
LAAQLGIIAPMQGAKSCERQLSPCGVQRVPLEAPVVSRSAMRSLSTWAKAARARGERSIHPAAKASMGR